MLVPGQLFARRRRVSTTKTVSATVRGRINSLHTASITSGTTWGVFRSRHKTNVAVTSPYITLWNGWCDNTGATVVENSIATTVAYKAAIVTGGTPSGTNNLILSGGTVTKLTFFGMLNDAAFVAASGVVSGDGFTCTAPAGYVVNSDAAASLNLTAGQVYYVQISDHRAAATTRGFNLKNQSALNEGNYYASDVQGEPTNGGTARVYNIDWVTGGAASVSQISFIGPTFVWAIGAKSAKVVCVHGDSIIAENNDVPGDADGAQCWAKRGLNAAGVSFFDLAVAGTRIRNERDDAAYAIRSRWLSRADVIMSNMGHNDLGSIGFNSNGSTSWLPLRSWENTSLFRAYAPAAKIVRATYTPRSGSADTWTTQTQTHTGTADDVWPTGARWEAYHYLLKLTANGYTYAGRASDGNEEDAVYDYTTGLYAGCATAGATQGIASITGLWPTDGTTANLTTPDGTHPQTAVHAAMAATFQTAIKPGGSLASIFQ